MDGIHSNCSDVSDLIRDWAFTLHTVYLTEATPIMLFTTKQTEEGWGDNLHDTLVSYSDI